jgi:Rrf2 family protein
MKLSRKSEYACLALIELSENYESKKMIKIDEIAKKKNIPKKYLEQILLILKGEGLLKSVSGSNGGYMLLKAPEEITVAEVIRKIDGPLAPVNSVSKYFYEETPIEQSEKLLIVLKDIRDFVSQKLENTTFKDLI